MPAENFDSLGAALMSVFIVFVGENWNDVWHTGFENSGWGATAFFLAAFLVGNFMLMNLFVAILCGNYDNDDEQPPLSAAKTPGAEAEGRRRRRMRRRRRARGRSRDSRPPRKPRCWQVALGARLSRAQSRSTGRTQ